MKISIVIPVYLSYSFLEKNFWSISKQTYKNIEIIYINDGSPDDSEELCVKFMNLDSRVVLFKQNNNGAAAALNKGIIESTGDYIMFIDADDWIEPNTCEIAINKALELGVDIVFWNNIKEYTNKSVCYPSFFPGSRIFKDHEIGKLRRRMIGLVEKELRNPMSTDAFNAGWGKLYRTEVIKSNRVTWTDTKYVGSSDVLFNAQLMPHVNSAYYLDAHLHHYNKSNLNSLTKTYNNTLRNKFENLFIELDRVIMYSYGDKEKEDFKLALNNRIALSTINIGLGYVNRGLSIEGWKAFESLIESNQISLSLKKFNINYLPMPYKLYFLFCKLKFTLCAYFILFLMSKLRRS